MASDTIRTLLEDVHRRRIVLPQFQRDFVWQPSAVIKLLVSIFNGYPIGSLLLMENTGVYDFRVLDGVNEGPTPSDVETILILDGQQRLTSCFRAFFGTLDDTQKQPGRYYFQFRYYCEQVSDGADIEGSSLQDFFVFEKTPRIRSKLATTAAELKEGLFPLDIIFGSPRGASYVKWLNDYCFSEAKGEQERFEKLSDLSARFQTRFLENVTGYQINYERITRETNPDVICTIFETINTTGIRLTVFDLLVAKCFRDNLRLRDKLSEALEQYTWLRQLDPERQEIAIPQLPRIISMLNSRQAKKGEVLKLRAGDVSRHWDRAVAALDNALRIIATRLGGLELAYIPSTDVITPLALVCADFRFREDAYMDRLARWYWCASLAQYLSTSPDSKIERVTRELLGPKDSGPDSGWIFGQDDEPESIMEFRLASDALVDATRQTGIYKGLMSLLITRGTSDLGPEKRRISQLSASDIEDHHIFPQKFLASNGIKGGRANGILNRMPISKVINRSIESKAPEIYIRNTALAGSISQSDLDAACVNLELLLKPFSLETYNDFLNDRYSRLLRAVATATGKHVDIIKSEDDE